MNLHVINTGFFKLDGGAMFGVVPKSLWSKINPADENNLCTWAMRCLLVEDEGRLILIDTGIGDKQDEKFLGHYHLHGGDSLEKSLAAAGFRREDITDVFLTHLHFDHCGGAIIRENEKLIPAFPNATYWCNQKHWEWAVNPNAREKASFLKENILPIRDSGRLQFVNDTQRENGRIPFIANMSVRIANGHTESMMLPQLFYRNRTLIFMADLLPSIGHLPLPYVMSYDMFPLTTLNEKEAFLEEALLNNYILFFEHDAVHECCELVRTEKGIRAGNIFRLDEIEVNT